MFNPKMNKAEFFDIWTTKVIANGPWYPTAINQDTLKLYRSKLSKYSVAVLSEAVNRLLEEETKKLPPVGKFIEYCRWVQGEGGNPKPKKLCPCCQGSGWIFLEEENFSVPCDCKKTNTQGQKTISEKYDSEKKCIAGECSPGGTIFINEKVVKLPDCPKGEVHYDKYLKKSMERFEEPLQEQIDPPGVGAEDLPF